MRAGGRCSGRLCLRQARLRPLAPRKLSPTTVCAEKEEGKYGKDELRNLENELRDPKNFLEYFLPRPVRLAFLGGSAASCLIATLISVSRSAAEGAQAAAADGTLANVGVNATGFAVFLALFIWDRKQAETRIEQRTQLRQAQIKFGDREVYTNPEGERMSKLKDVDDEWILRRLERWGRRSNMPFLGPDKAAILQGIIREARPSLVVEVGAMCGYSAIRMAQALPDGGRIISIEKDWKWVLAAKRFLWQSSQGEKNRSLRSAGLQPIGARAQVLWGDALELLPSLKLEASEEGVATGGIDLLFLDGVPKETLAYLQAAEGLLNSGAVVVADNAGVFKDGGLRPYLEYVRGSDNYSSRFVESHFEWRDDVPDGMEVSVFQPGGHGDSRAAAQVSAPSAVPNT